MSTTSTLIHFVLNAERVSVEVETNETLLEVVRDRFALNGCRESCGQGLCGCCTLLVDGQSVSGCLYPAPFADGAEVMTVEHLDASGTLDPIQEAFIQCGAFQCGFCTSGFILMSRELLDRNPDPSEDEIRNALSGNLCRCGAYPEIIRAVQLAATLRRSTLEEAH